MGSSGAPLRAGGCHWATHRPPASEKLHLCLHQEKQNNAPPRPPAAADQTQGQVVIDYVVEYQAAAGGAWQPFSAGTTIGSKRIDVLAAPVQAVALRLTIASAFSAELPVTLSAFVPDGCATSS